MLVIGGSASEGLAENLAGELECEYSSIERKEFPDGEIYVRIKEDVESEEVVIV
ncbi:MAG: ribose-phosphate pyrophosphokinase-like domain-containing protein, partial [Candidatus Aenigmatarchaeota archaeon]